MAGRRAAWQVGARLLSRLAAASPAHHSGAHGGNSWSSRLGWPSMGRQPLGRLAGGAAAGGALLCSGCCVVAFADAPSVTSEPLTREDAALADFVTESGVLRSIYFWSKSFPIFLQYKAVEWWFKGAPWEDQEGYFEWLHDRYAPTAEKLCLGLKGFYLKGAQVASTRDDLLPRQYLTFCKRFQDEVPSEFRDEEDLHDAICASLGTLGKHHDEVFEWIDPTPIGSASIGVVHRAKLRGGGEVAVKVQLPGIEQKFRNDIATVKKFCALALPSHLPFLDELERQFLTEFDYTKEARNLNQARSAMSRSPFRRRVVVPRAHEELCTKTVMVMDFLDGENLLKSVVGQFTRFAAQRGLTLEQMAELQASGSGDARPPSRARAGGRAVARLAVRVLDAGHNCAALAAHAFSLVFVLREKRRPFSWRQTEFPIDLAGTLDLLLRVHAYQIFQEGEFNADPHPGNIMLLRDGRVGLVDYGQVKRISPRERALYARLVLALAEGDRDEAVRVATGPMGLVTKHMDAAVIYRLLLFFHDRDTEDVTGGMNVQRFMDWANEADPIVSLDEAYVMCGRVSLLLRGLGNAFGMKIAVTKYWQDAASERLRAARRAGEAEVGAG